MEHPLTSNRTAVNGHSVSRWIPEQQNGARTYLDAFCTLILESDIRFLAEFRGRTVCSPVLGGQGSFERRPRKTLSSGLNRIKSGVSGKLRSGWIRLLQGSFPTPFFAVMRTKVSFANYGLDRFRFKTYIVKGIYIVC